MIQFFVPLMTHSSPSRTAVVRIAAGSEPASGSDRQNAGDHSPVAQRGSQRSFCSSVPNSWIGSVPSSWTIRISALDAQALAISSTAIWSISVPVPVPPYSSANGSAEEVLLGEQLADVPRVLARGVDLGRARGDALAHDLADRVAEVLELLRDVVDVGQRRGHGQAYGAWRIAADRTGTPWSMGIGTSCS